MAKAKAGLQDLGIFKLSAVRIDLSPSLGFAERVLFLISLPGCCVEPFQVPCWVSFVETLIWRREWG